MHPISENLASRIQKDVDDIRKAMKGMKSRGCSSRIKSYDWLNPSIIGKEVPLKNPASEYRYYLGIQRVLVSVLETRKMTETQQDFLRTRGAPYF